MTDLAPALNSTMNVTYLPGLDNYTAVGTEVHYACDKYFLPMGGNHTRTCDESLQWSGDPLVCVRKLFLQVEIDL